PPRRRERLHRSRSSTPASLDLHDPNPGPCPTAPWKRRSRAQRSAKIWRSLVNEAGRVSAHGDWVNASGIREFHWKDLRLAEFEDRESELAWYSNRRIAWHYLVKPAPSPDVEPMLRFF